MQTKKGFNVFWGIILCLWIYDMISPLVMFFEPARFLRYFLIVIGGFLYFQIPKSTIAKKDTLFKLFAIWSFFIILRGSLILRFPLAGSDDFTTYQFVTSIYAILLQAFSSFSVFCFLLPFVFSINFKKETARFVYIIPRLSIVTCLVSLMLILFFREAIFSTTFGATNLIKDGEVVSLRHVVIKLFPSLTIICLAAFMFPYLKRKWVYWIVPATLFAYFVLNVMSGGRGDSFMSFIYCAAFLFFFYKYNSYNQVRHSNKFFGVVLILFAIYGVYYLYAKTDLFNFLVYRSFQDGVGSDFVENNRDIWVEGMKSYFNANPHYWIFGRGVNGYYVMSNGGMRQWLEYGFLWLILKGGVVYLFLFCALLLRSAYRGLLRSSNLFCKACGMVCLLRVVALIPYGMPDISLSSLIVWMCCGVLLDSEIRKMSDLEIAMNIWKKNY